MKEKIKSVLKRLAEVRGIGPFVHMAAAIWRGPLTRQQLEAQGKRIRASEERIAEIERNLRIISEGYGSAIKGLDISLKRQHKELVQINGVIGRKADCSCSAPPARDMQ